MKLCFARFEMTWYSFLFKLMRASYKKLNLDFINSR